MLKNFPKSFFSFYFLFSSYFFLRFSRLFYFFKGRGAVSFPREKKSGRNRASFPPGALGEIANLN